MKKFDEIVDDSKKKQKQKFLLLFLQIQFANSKMLFCFHLVMKMYYQSNISSEMPETDSICVVYTSLIRIIWLIINKHSINMPTKLSMRQDGAFSLFLLYYYYFFLFRSVYASYIHKRVIACIQSHRARVRSAHKWMGIENRFFLKK